MIANNPQLELALLIHDISMLSDRVYDRLIKPRVKITLPQLWVLLHLAETENDGLMQVELARYLGVNPIGLGKMIDRMEKIEIVVRVAEKRDRRSNRVVLTPKGRNALSRIEKTGVVQEGLPVQGIPQAQIRQLIVLLKLLKASAAALDQQVQKVLTKTPPKPRQARVPATRRPLITGS